MLRLAFVGKGGTGKSVIAGTLARLLAASGEPVLAIDSDPLPGLAFSIGMERSDAGLPDEAVEERPEGEPGPRYRLRPDLSPGEAVERYAAHGPDGVRFAELLTPRDLSKCAVGEGRYVLLTDEAGGIVNDPVLLRMEENRFWLACADSDVLLWAKGVARGSGMRVELRELDVAPLQVQGPKSRQLVTDMFGDRVSNLKYYEFRRTELEGIPVIVTRTGWTGELGYELYLLDPARGLEQQAVGRERERLVAEPGRLLAVPALASIYGIGYWPQRAHARPAIWVRLFLGLLTAAMTLLVVARDAVLFLVGRRQDDDRQQFRPVVGTHLPQHLEPVHPRQLQIQQHDLRHVARVAAGPRAAPEQEVEGLHAVASHDDLVHDVRLAQRPECQRLVVGVVLDQQDRLRVVGRHAGRPRHPSMK